MRTAFAEGLIEAAAADDRVWLVCGDLGYSVVEAFAARFPGRFLNAGVAEQNMTGVAAGLAHAGNVVFVYSIANFPVVRCLEQVRNDVCYHNLDVKVVAVGGGLVYGGHGYSHHGSEDVALMRVLPNMTVLAPGDPAEARLATRAAATHPGPVYLRLGRGGEPAVHRDPPPFRVGAAIPVRRGRDVTLLSTGVSLPLAAAAADELAAGGASVELLSLPTVCPMDAAAVCRSAAKTGRVVTVEEHGHGGLAAVVAEVLLGAGVRAAFRPVHLPREPVTVAGSHADLRRRAGVDASAVVRAAAALLSAPRP